MRTSAHIEAHFLICYIALALIRTLQLLTDFKYSASAILDDLSQVSATNADSDWWLFDQRTSLTEELFTLIGKEAPRKWMTLSDTKALFSKKITPSVKNMPTLK
ncbi:MAG: hypothetical protein IKE43_05930 [Coriobacteriales bacterium]|nr:hypothetical protein [Coriobacteriales bacterium]